MLPTIPPQAPLVNHGAPSSPAVQSRPPPQAPLSNHGGPLSAMIASRCAALANHNPPRAAPLPNHAPPRSAAQSRRPLERQNRGEVRGAGQSRCPFKRRQPITVPPQAPLASHSGPLSAMIAARCAAPANHAPPSSAAGQSRAPNHATGQSRRPLERHDGGEVRSAGRRAPPHRARQTSLTTSLDAAH